MLVTPKEEVVTCTRIVSLGLLANCTHQNSTCTTSFNNHLDTKKTAFEVRALNCRLKPV